MEKQIIAEDLNSRDESQGDLPILQAHHLRKEFSGTVAVKDISLELFPGKVVAVVGENGAGKSTLKNLLIGLLEPNDGYIELEGAQLPNKFHAADFGIGAVHQEFSLFNELTVAENVCIIDLPGAKPLVNWSKINKVAQKYLDMVGVDFPSDMVVSNLSTGEQQQVEIAKALRHASKVLILDEPTTSLTNPERDRLFSIVRKLRDNGLAIIYISHFIDEVYEIADSAVVLRDGFLVGGGDVSELPRARLEELMVGRHIEENNIQLNTPSNETLMRVEDFSSGNEVHGISLNINHGEILGISGLMGAGRSELCEAIFGLRPHNGKLWFDGETISHPTPVTMRSLGVSFVPEDRRRNGLFGIRSLKENLTVAALKNLVQRVIPGLGFRGEKENAKKIADDLSVVYSKIENDVRFLSGGNQQKALLARWLAIDPKLCIFDEPTRGVDIGAKEEIHRLIRELAANGVAVLMASSDLPELLMLCHRILIMRNGTVVKELTRDQFNPMTIIKYAASEAEEFEL